MDQFNQLFSPKPYSMEEVHEPSSRQRFCRLHIKWYSNGFRLGVNPQATYTLVSRNMQSALLHQDVIDEYLKQEIELRNILGTFQKTTAPVVHVNRFGVIPKKHQIGKWWLITDLPFPVLMTEYRC